MSIVSMLYTCVHGMHHSTLSSLLLLSSTLGSSSFDDMDSRGLKPVPILSSRSPDSVSLPLYHGIPLQYASKHSWIREPAFASCNNCASVRVIQKVPACRASATIPTMIGLTA